MKRLATAAAGFAAATLTVALLSAPAAAAPGSPLATEAGPGAAVTGWPTCCGDDD